MEGTSFNTDTSTKKQPGAVYMQSFPAGQIDLMGTGGVGSGNYYVFLQTNSASSLPGASWTTLGRVATRTSRRGPWIAKSRLVRNFWKCFGTFRIFFHIFFEN